ncbi:tyrosine-protein phosphatase 3-like [Copidosoma floridanum]|uniref:tyrosine-protein phosphatase 3-like n=1 Tax=Copidosoma floridanum TaxID=29053 RepID=UPI0006C9A0DA|nr:tyrosine-protein phosphatase 3-like [Copidosoma floridanum]
MEFQNIGMYECRNSMNYFSGGTVYDTSVIYENPVCTNTNFTSLQINRQNEFPIDSITHLDDDEFNNHVDSNVTRHVGPQMTNTLTRTEKFESLPYHSSQNNRANVSNFFDPVSGNFNHQIGNYFNGSLSLPNAINNFANRSLSVDVNTTDEEGREVFSQSSSLPSTVSILNSSSDSSWQESNESFTASPSTTARSLSNSRLTHRRKQTHVIIDDYSLEMPNEDNGTASYETKGDAFSCENDKRFGQIKMKSILKSRKPIYNNSNNNNNDDDDYVHHRNLFSSNSKLCSNDKRSTASSSMNFSMEKISNNLPVSTPFNSLQIGTEFTQPNYLDYVPPFEKIDTNTEKLITPNINLSAYQIAKASQVKLAQAKQVDHSGIDISFPNENGNLSTSEIAEKALCLKSAYYSEKFDYDNIFNTSNEAIINEVFFDETSAYKGIELDLSFRIDKVRVEPYQLPHKAFNSVSLMESLDELKRFGGITGENGTEKKYYKIPFANCESVETYGDSRYNQQKLYQCTNIVNLSSTCESDDPSSEETVTSSETENNQPLLSLKIKIKRIANNKKNKFVIDNSIEPYVYVNDRKIMNKANRNTQRYQCADCLEKFRTKKLLISHVSAYHKGPYDTECDVCHMKFKRSSAHKPHLPWCERYKKFKCDLCSKEYCYNASLQKHLKTHEKLFNTESYFDQKPMDYLTLYNITEY